MRVGDLMSRSVLRLSVSEPASDALALMREEGIRHAVVLLGDRLVGIISDRDLGGPHGGPIRVRHTVGDLMHADPLVVASRRMSLERAVALVLENRIGCLPIVERGRVLGIVTRSDLLRASAPRARVRARPASARRRAATTIDARPSRVASPTRDKMP